MPTLQERAQELLSLKADLEDAKLEVSELQRVYDDLRQKIVPDEMDTAGISSANFPGIGRLTLTADLFAGIQAGQQQDAYQWLEEQGHADLIKNYVHPSTLKAWIKGEIEAGVILPEALFKVTPFQRASVTKIA